MLLIILLLLFGFKIIINGSLALFRIGSGFFMIIAVIMIALYLLKLFANTFGYILVLILFIGLFIKLLS